MKRRNEYEVTVEPCGRWTVRHIHDESVREVAQGSHKGIRRHGEDLMGRAEQEARQWVADKLAELESHEEYRKRCRIFTIPATITRLAGS